MKLILYTKTGCPWSQEIREMFATHNVQYEERNMSENRQYYDEAIEKSGMAKSPTLDIDGEIYADTDVAVVRKILVKKKYPGF